MNAISPLGFVSTLALGAVLAAGPESLPSASAQSAAAPDDRPVVIYRCTDAQGRSSLRDSPCRQGERQNVREMTRPKDPVAIYAKRTANPALAASQTAAVSPQVLIVRSPLPLYECASPDNQRYLSDSPEGKLRWVQRNTTFVPTQMPLYDPSYGFVNVGQGNVYANHGGIHPPHPVVVDNGAWVRDTCYALPQADACARLRDERGTLGRRRFNAQQTERVEIDREERRVDARLAQDCG